MTAFPDTPEDLSGIRIPACLGFPESDGAAPELTLKNAREVQWIFEANLQRDRFHEIRGRQQQHRGVV
jgi:hypothetical protein